MAKPKKISPPFPKAPFVPDEIWVPFLVGLTGDKAHDNRAIANLAHIFNLDPQAIKFRVAEEVQDRFVFPTELTLH
jgi:hypothetical protein